MTDSSIMLWLMFVQLGVFLGPGVVAYGVYLWVERRARHRDVGWHAPRLTPIGRTSAKAAQKKTAA